MALRPFSSASAPSSSSSTPSSTASSLIEYKTHEGKRQKTAHEFETEDSQYILVVNHILAIPLLALRFANGGLSSITQTLLKPSIFNGCCRAICKRGDSIPRAARTWDGMQPNYCGAGYLLGNLLELGLNHSAPTNFMEYLSTLRTVLLVLPQNALPSETDAPGTAMHPLVKNQLELFRGRALLVALAQRLEVSVQESKLTDASTVTGVIDALLHKWQAFNTDILNSLVFSTKIVTVLWSALLSLGVLEMFRDADMYKQQADSRAAAQLTDMVSLMCVCYSHLLLILDDQDFFEKQHPFRLEEVGRMVGFFKALLLQYYWKENSPLLLGSLGAQEPVSSAKKSSLNEDSEDDDGVEVKRAPKKAPSRMQTCLTRLFLNLRDRYARKPFCSPDVWTMNIPMEVFHDELARGNDRAFQLIHNIPFVLPFDERVRIFYENIARDQDEWREGGLEFDHGRGVMAVIRRNKILIDGYEKLYHLGNRLKGRVQVTFIDEYGSPEAGIDGGGLFKEFITAMLKAALNPELGLFRTTPDHSLYPNPDSAVVVDFDHLKMFRFLGRIVGKALYDGIQIEPQFANFFLRECLGRKNTVDELMVLDPELYKHLLFLKTYDGDIEELGLTFSLDRTSFDKHTEIPLIPNGEMIPVTRDNRMQFVMYLADYRLNKETREQSRAFVSGVHDIINLEWLRMFSSDELSLLISGAPHIDIDDLRQNTNYANGYSANHELIKWFWEAVSEFDATTQAGFLRFVTSCSRAPLLGFKALYPKFCVQHVSAGPDEALLPTSSTCMNLFRLPRYFSKKQLVAKLLYAINSGSGFGLT